MFKRLLRSKTLQARARWIVAIIMVPPFAIFFHMWTGGGAIHGPGGSAGILFGRAVPWEDFQQELILIRRNAQAQFGSLPEGLGPYFRQQAWDRLTLKAEAKRRIKVSDEDVSRFIQKQPTFQQNGRFSPDFYFRFVQGMGFTPQAFEERVRDDLRIEKLLDAVKAETILTDDEVQAAYAKEHEQARAALLLTQPATFEPRATQALTEPALREYYAAHQEALRLPSKRVIEYVGMSLSDVREADRPIREEDIRAYYEDHPEDFKQQDGSGRKPLEEVRGDIQQALKTEAAGKRLKQFAGDLEEDVDNGLRFVEIALTRGLRAHRVGPIEPHAPAVPNGPTSSMLGAAFEVPVGGMTQVFSTPIGVFLLTPLEVIESRVPPFEEVRDRVKTLAVHERSREAAKARAAELREQLLAKRKQGFTLEETSLLLGVALLRPAPFTRQGPIEGLGEAASVAQALLALKPGEFSEVLEVPKGFVVGFLEERLAFDAGRFAADNDAFRKSVLEIRQQEHATRWLEALRAKARLKSFLETSDESIVNRP